MHTKLFILVSVSVAEDMRYTTYNLRYAKKFALNSII
jgi:hypothetical protein